MLKRLLNLFKTGNKDVLILMLGTVISQAVPILASFFLARIYTPEDFGLFQVYFSISMVGTVFMTMRYEMAIMLPEKKEDARHVFVLSCLIAFAWSVIILLLVFLFRHPFAHLMKQPSLANSLFVLPFTLLVIGVYQSLNYWSNRHKQYTRLSFSRVARSVNSSVFSIAFGFVSFMKSTGLIIGDSLGQASSSLFLGARLMRDEPGLFRNVSKAKLKEMAHRYRQFPLFNVPSGLLEKLSGNLPALILIPFYGATVVGLFSMSQRMISVPGSVVARAFGDVFRQSATEQYIQNKECKHLFLQTLKKLTILSVPAFTVLFFIVEPLFVIAFGEEWREAGTYARILMPMFLLQFIVSPLSNMFLVAEQQKKDFFLQICLFLAILSALYGGYYVFKSPTATLMLYSGVYTLKYIVELILSYGFSKGKKHAG
ncbi:MAG: oligosaccharide flippase family protein [Flavobacteriia bacterium]|nr:oligosaccharide flippase family protein [Flavobacteriia bacterium]